MSLKLPDGKIVYNLPEQVAKNADDIKKIAAVLDGLNIQDNVVAIADISQILTRAELDIVEKPVAFLYYSDQLYIKRNEVGGSAFFDVIFSITGSTVISFTSKVIEVVLTTGALVLTTSTYSTYSKSELDTKFGLKADITYVDAQLALKANLSGATFTGAVKAPTLEQSNVNYEQSFNFNNYVGLTITNVYNKFIVVNNMLYIIANIKLTNDTENSISINPAVSSFGQINVTLPSGIASKIYDMEGDPVTSPKANVRNITAVCCKYKNNLSQANMASGTFILGNGTPANQVNCYLFPDETVTIGPGDSLYVMGRMFISLF